MKNRWIWMLLSMLGFASACNEDGEPERELPAPEYGCPYTTFEVKGKVIKAHNKRALSGMAVNIQISDPEDGESTISQTTVTNGLGEFAINAASDLFRNPEEVQATLRITDPDGAVNDLYPTREVPVTLKLDPNADTSGWREAHYLLEDVVIEMERDAMATPAVLRVSGRVTDPDSKPLIGIKVYYDENFSTKSSYDGRFSLAVVVEGEAPNILTIHFTDVDGEEGGGWFADRQVEVAFTPEESDERSFTAEEVLMMLEPEGMMEEYGTPYVTFSVKGRVTDPVGWPIEGIEVSIGDEARTLTDAEGNYTIDKQHGWLMNPEGEDISICFRDIDGPANREFLNKEVVVDFVANPDYTEDSNWHQGHYEAPEAVDVTLNWKSITGI